MKTPIVALALLLGLCNNNKSFSQVGDAHVHGQVKDQKSKVLIQKAQIVVQTGSDEFKYYSNEKGKYDIILELGKKYFIRYEAEGYLTKTIELDFSNVPNLESDPGIDMQVDGTLLKQCDEFNMNLLSVPIAKAYYDPASYVIVFDFDYSAERSKYIQFELERIKGLCDDKMANVVPKEKSRRDARRERRKHVKQEQSANENKGFELVSNIDPDKKVFDAANTKSAAEQQGLEGLELRISPNPNNGSFQIITNQQSINTTGELTITDLSGKLIYQSKLSGETIQIALQDPIPGIYFLRYTCDKGTRVVKFIVG